VILDETARGGNTRARVAALLQDISDTAALKGELESPLDGAGHAIVNFDNAHSAANLALTTGGSTAFPATTLDCAALGLVSGHVYSATMGWRVRQWRDGPPPAAGCVEFVEDVIIAVVLGVATITFNRTPMPDCRGLGGTALAAGTAAIVASAGGFTVSATRGAAVNCHANWRMWCAHYEDIT